VPANIVGKLVSTPPDDMYYLTEADKRSMFNILGETSTTPTTTTSTPTPVFTPPEPEPMPPTPAPAAPVVPAPAPQPVAPQTYRVTITDQRGNNLIYDFVTGSSPDILVETAYTKNGQTLTSTGTTWEYRPGQSGGSDFVQMTDSRWWLNCNLSVATLLHNGNVVGHGYCGSPGPLMTPPALQPAMLPPYDADCFVVIGGYTHLNGHCMFSHTAGWEFNSMVDNSGRVVTVNTQTNSGTFTGLKITKTFDGLTHSGACWENPAQQTRICAWRGKRPSTFVATR
jgi:hypothetical protein